MKEPQTPSEIATHNLAMDLALFVAGLRTKCNCSKLEATVLAKAIISQMLDAFNSEDLERFQQFIAKVREVEKG